MKKIIKMTLLVILTLMFTQQVNAETLNCNYTYRNGSTGANVKVLQQRLNEEENCNLTVDGIFGNKTYNCVVKYQRNNNLGVDGIVGKKTCAKLNEVKENDTPEVVKPVTGKIYLTTAEVNFRQGPGTNYYTYGTVKKNTEVEVIEFTNSSWYKVSYNNKIGYISTSYLTEKVNSPLKTNEYFVLGTTVNVRKGPSTSYGKVTTLKRGSKVIVTGKSSNWYKVKINNKTGYIRNDLISKDLVIVDISDQMLYYFKGTETILVANVVTGRKDRHDTPLGNYVLYTSSKERDRYLRGYNDDGSRYNSYVTYWMPFNGGVGFHDATWRSASQFNNKTYITNGSHGCVNMKKADAKVLYENTTVNTFVQVRQ